MPLEQTQFAEQLPLPRNAVNGKTGAELAEDKVWWSATWKVGHDKRARKYFAEKCVPQVLGQWKEKAEVTLRLFC